MAPMKRTYRPIGEVKIGSKVWPFDRDEFEWLIEKLDPNDEWTKQARAQLAELDAERENDAYMEHGQPGGKA